MGGQLYTVFRPSVPEAQPPDDVRALYLHLDEADRLAREIGVTPLGNFLSAAVEGPIHDAHGQRPRDGDPRATQGAG